MTDHIETIPTTTSPFQQRVLQFRNHCNIFNGGGRGSGKSVSLMFHILDHVRELGPAANVLLLRESWPGLMELQFRLYQLARIAFGPAVSQNKSSGTLEFPNGGKVFFRNIADDVSFASAQGRSYSFLAGDEYGNLPEPAIRFMRLLRSNLRPPLGIRPVIHLTANPFGRAHTHCLKTYINKAPPFTPYQDENGEWWVNCTSTYEDNPFIDKKNYRNQLLSATAGNPGLMAAWVDGNWRAKGGGLLFDMFDRDIHCIIPPSYGHRMKHLVGFDYGSSSPSVGILLAELLDPVGNYIPGDYFVRGMFDTCAKEGDYTEGDGSSAALLAHMTKQMLDSFGLPYSTQVVCDDLRGLSNETVVSIFRDQGLTNTDKPERKDRMGGWALIRNRLDGAKHGDNKGLWINQNCEHLIATLELAPRDDVRSEDVSRHYKQDHALDALNYAVTAMARRSGGSGMARVIGGY